MCEGELSMLPLSVLIVEDDVVTQQYLSEILVKCGINQVHCYDNAKDTMEALEVFTPDMIFMDININGAFDGIRLAQTILDSVAIPIVFVTGYNDTEVLQEALKVSPYGYIVKPFTPSDIEAVLHIAYKRFVVYEEALNQIRQEEQDVIVLGKIHSYSLKQSVLYCKGEPVRLNTKHKKLIDILANNINKTVSFETLISEIWQGKDIAASSLRTLVYMIRKQYPDLPIYSYSKLGYSLEGTLKE